MQVLFYDDNSVLNTWFGQPDYKIPFLATNLLNFNTLGFLRLASSRGEVVKIHVPSYWYEDLDNKNLFTPYDGSSIQDTLANSQANEYELVFIISLASVFVSDLSLSDISHMKENPEKLFSNPVKGVIGGYLKKGQELPSLDSDFPLFDAFIKLSPSNFLRLNQDLVGQLSVKSVETEARVYGDAIILSENISNDTVICAPCYIGKDVVINSSYIGAGTILRGHSRLTSSRVFGSFVVDTHLEESEITDSILSDSFVQGVTLKNSLLPNRSEVVNDVR